MNELTDSLVRSGLATHVVRLAEGREICEADLVGALLESVPGLLFRTGPCIYAFDGGRAEDQPGTVASALASVLGEGAVTVEKLPSQRGAVERADTMEATWPEERSIVLLRAMAESAKTAVAAEAPGLRAVIDAEFAVRAARLTAEGLLAGEIATGDRETIDSRLGQIEAALLGVERRAEELLARSGTEAAIDGMVARLDGIETALRALDERLSEEADEDSIAATSGVLARIEERLDDVDRHLTRLRGIASGTSADQVAAFGRFSTALSVVLRRMDLHADALEATVARLGNAEAALGQHADPPPCDSDKTILQAIAELDCKIGRLEQKLEHRSSDSLIQHALAELLALAQKQATTKSQK